MTEHIPSEPLLDVDEVLKILDQISIFGGLSGEKLNAILRLLKRVHYKAREIIFKEGSQPSYIYIIQSGRVRLVYDYDNHPMSKREFGVGECFGAISVIGIVPHSVTTVATEDTELLVLAREDLLSIFDSDKELFGLLMMNIARAASRRLYEADRLIEQLLK